MRTDCSKAQPYIQTKIEQKDVIPRPAGLADVQLKHSIVTYRMLETEMDHLDVSAFEEGVDEDLVPIVATLAPSEKVPALMKWLSKDPNAVVQFYRQFQSVADMKAYVVKTSGHSAS